MKKKSEIPKSKARNAYELLSEIRALILAEPKRYNQMHFLQTGKGPEFPACGTIGCVAGWVATLKWTDPSIGVEYKAINVLGLGRDQAEELFSGAALDALPEGQKLIRTPGGGKRQLCDLPGTPAYAKLGAKHIWRFQKKYAKQLKAKAV